jgi:glucose/arabinose dehydrogenase
MFSIRAIAASVALAVAALLPGAASGGEFGSEYVAQGKCGPFPRAAVATPAWACLGIVAGPADGLIMPRSLVEVSPGRLFLIDMGGWDARNGRLVEVRLGADGSRMFTTLLRDLNQPSGLALGPDGKLYVGEADVIWRFDPSAEKVERETVIGNLPGTGQHPLKYFSFDTNGDMIVNIGSSTDRCEAFKGQLTNLLFPCPDVDGNKPRAAVWRLHFDKLGGKVESFKPIARGLRNSMGLAVEPKTGLIVQANNNIDYKPDNDPPESLNVIKQGANFGWPYCTYEGPLSKLGLVYGYERFAHQIDCNRFDKPAVLVPAHGAPLGALYYYGAMFPELTGKLIVSLHGYRNNGHRLVAYDRAADGTPIAPKTTLPSFPFEIITDWGAKPGSHPMGAPVNISVGLDGQIWFAEDRNKTLMVLLRGGAAPKAADAVPAPAVKSPPRGWDDFARVVSPVCSQCHEDFKAGTTAAIWTNLVQHGFVNQDDLGASKFVHAMRGEAPFRLMPPPGVGSADDAKAALAAFLAGQ